MNATAQAIGSAGTASNILFGRFMLPDMTEHPCQVHAISVHGATFMTSHIPAPGTAIVAYLEEVGRVEATSAEMVSGGFKVAFALTGARRERFENRLSFLNKKQQGTAAEDRRHTRYEPRDSKSQITMPDGREYPCEVVDISLSGAAIKVDVLPSLGTYILLGKMRGRVVRYIENGIGIEFMKMLDRKELNDHIR